ncbi:STE3-domain-containing protein [Agrocybe pediades]|nr:STE3-domain-containing protein [Agrocybe pediades]
MVDSLYPIFPIFAFLGFVLVLIPLPWHLQALNSGTCLFMIWTAVGCLNQFVNSIVWHGNIVDRAPIWCDISTRLTVGIAVAIPAASLCINRRLYKIATCKTATITYAERKRAVVIDLCIGLGLPLLQMILQVIVQGHRYDIWGDIGCLPTTVNTPPAYPLSFVWPNVISLVSAVYCVLTLKAFMHRRAQFSQYLSSTASISVNLYFRLMCLATTDILITVPVSSYGLYLNMAAKPIYPWKSWSDTHFDFLLIDSFPAFMWRQSPIATVVLESSRWLVVVCAFVFFAFFGFADEARRNYTRCYRIITRRLGCALPSKQGRPDLDANAKIHPLKNNVESLPSYVDSAKATPSFAVWRQSADSIDSHGSWNCGDTLYGSPTSPNHKQVSTLKPTLPPNPSRLSRATI